MRVTTGWHLALCGAVRENDAIETYASVEVGAVSLSEQALTDAKELPAMVEVCCRRRVLTHRLSQQTKFYWSAL